MPAKPGMRCQNRVWGKSGKAQDHVGALDARGGDRARLRLHAATGHEVELELRHRRARLQKRLDTGETADVLITAIPAIDRLEQAGAADGRHARPPIATTRIGVAMREGAPRA